MKNQIENLVIYSSFVLMSSIALAQNQPLENKPKTTDDYKFEAVQPNKKDVLKTGDVVKSVNGKPVNSPEAAMKLYEELKKKGDTSVIVERDGNQKKVNIKKSVEEKK